jgi:DNA-binding CsgD family transcriptional regulator
VWKRVFIYGVLLGLGTLALQGLEYQRLARLHTGEFYLFAVALAFGVLGLVVGMRLMRRPPPRATEGNAQAQATLGISARELQVLQELAAGRSNKEIAERLHLSPHTVKTHVSHLFEKLGARRRTEAIHRARELGIVP